MANRHFNKQTTHTRQALAKGGKVKKGKSSPGPREGRQASPGKGLGLAGLPKKKENK